jgi:adenylate kinase
MAGGPGSGKGTQCERLVKEHKFSHVSTGDIMRWEVNNKTPEGQRLEAIMAKGEFAPTELTVSLLMKAIKRLNGTRYLIDGFPRGLDQAIFLEGMFEEIEFVLNLEASDEVIKERLLDRAKTSGRIDDNEETIKKRIDKFNTETREVIKFYSKYGRVEGVNALGTIEEVYKEVTQVLKPRVVFVYGPPGTGISTISKALSEHLYYQYIDVNALFKEKRLERASDEAKTKALVDYLRCHRRFVFVVDGFPANRTQANIYYDHLDDVRFVYLQSSKDEAEMRISELFAGQKETIRKKRDELLKYYQNRKDVLELVEKRPTFVSVKNCFDSVLSPTELVKNIFNLTLFLAYDFGNPDTAKQYLEDLESQRGFLVLDYQTMIENEKKRNTEIGKTLQGSPEPADIMRLFRKIMYGNPKTRRVVIHGLPSQEADFAKEFEEHCMRISKVLLFIPKGSAYLPEGVGSLLDGFGFDQRVLLIDEPSLEYVDTFLTPPLNYGLIFGPSVCGKTLVADFLAKRFGIKVLKFDKLKEEVAKKKNPDGDGDDIKLEEIFTYAKDTISKSPKGTFHLLDGFNFNKAQFDQLFGVLGLPRHFVVLNVSQENVEKRTIEKNEGGELSEDDQANIAQNIQITNQLAEYFEGIATSTKNVHIYKVDGNTIKLNMCENVGRIYQKRIILARLRDASFDANVLRESLTPHCLERDTAIVDVPRVWSHYMTGSPFEEQIYSDLSMAGEQSTKLTPKLIAAMVNAYIKEMGLTQRNVLLFNYQISADREPSEKQVRGHPEALDDLVELDTQIGTVRALIDIGGTAHQSNAIQDIWEEKKEEEAPPPPKAVVDPDDPGAQAADPDPDPEDEENKNKFKPELYHWKRTDVSAKTLGQLFVNSRRAEEVNSFGLKKLGFFSKIDSR